MRRIDREKVLAKITDEIKHVSKGRFSKASKGLAVRLQWLLAELKRSENHAAHDLAQLQANFDLEKRLHVWSVDEGEWAVAIAHANCEEIIRGYVDAAGNLTHPTLTEFREGYFAASQGILDDLARMKPKRGVQVDQAKAQVKLLDK